MSSAEDHSRVNPQLKTIRGEVRTGKNCLTTNGYNNSLVLETKIVNLTDIPLYIGLRDGSIATVMPHPSGPRTGAIVIAHSVRNPLGKLEVLSGFECETTNLTRSLISEGTGDTYREEVIQLEDIINQREGVYVPDADVCVNVDPDMIRRYHHPRCGQKIHNDYLSDVGREFCPESMVNVGVRFIDNEGSYGEKFIIFHDRILPLKPITDPVLKSGLYVTGLRDIGAVGSSFRTDEYHTIEDAIAGTDTVPFKLYPSQAQARVDLHSHQIANQDIELIEREAARKHESEITRLKQERAFHDQNWEQRKHDMDMDRKTLESKLKEQEDLIQRMKTQRESELHAQKYQRDHELLEQQRISNAGKATVDNTQLGQKMLLETVKTIGICLTAGITVYSIFN